MLETECNAKGVKLVELATDDKLLAVARVIEVKDEEGDAGAENAPVPADS